MLEIDKIVKRKLTGTVDLPSSKSMCNRYLLIAALSGQEVSMPNLSASNDVVLLQKALQSKEQIRYFEDAGTPLRFFLAYAALLGLDVMIDGGERLRARPLIPLLKALGQLGAEFEYMGESGSMPLRVRKGVNLLSTHVTINASLSSQFLSAILLIAPCFTHGLTIIVNGEQTSEPYIDMTIEAMKQSGVEMELSGHTYTVKAGAYRIAPDIHIESDWSSATFIYALAATVNEADIFLPYLRLDSSQGDAATAKIFEQFGLQSEQLESGVRIKTSGFKTDFFEHNLKDIPDMFPALVAVCSFLKISARLTGVANLVFKESDRIKAMQENLLQTGAVLSRIGEDELQLSFQEEYHTDHYKFKSFDDHRIAMACSLFASKKAISIDEASVVKKSFPHYWNVFRALMH